MRRWLIVSVVAALLAMATPAHALPIVAGPRILTLGDSIVWQQCDGPGQQWPVGAPQYLRDRDGGCHGWSGATTAEMVYEIQGGRFLSNGPGQPHPHFAGRGQYNEWNMQEAIDRADILVLGLGTNDSNRMVGCGDRLVSPWPIQIPRDPAIGPRDVPCQLTLDEFRGHIDYFMWRAQGKPVIWYTVGVTNPADPAAPNQVAINEQLYGAQARYRNLHIIQWDRIVAARPDYLRDGVHLGPAGGIARNQALVDTLWGLGYR